jgi:hypothetical protein
MKQVAKENLEQLKALLTKINNSNYTKKLEILSGSTVGQHMRHILEFYLLLVSGSVKGLICYDQRKRDIRIESDLSFAINIFDELLDGIESLDLSKAVRFEADFTTDASIHNLLESSIGRELAYCTEHSIHHQAMIKAALFTMGESDLIDENFGVAYSTIRYKKSVCAQ